MCCLQHFPNPRWPLALPPSLHCSCLFFVFLFSLSLSISFFFSFFLSFCLSFFLSLSLSLSVYFFVPLTFSRMRRGVAVAGASTCKTCHSPADAPARLRPDRSVDGVFIDGDHSCSKAHCASRESHNLRPTRSFKPSAGNVSGTSRFSATLMPGSPRHTAAQEVLVFASLFVGLQVLPECTFVRLVVGVIGRCQCSKTAQAIESRGPVFCSVLLVDLAGAARDELDPRCGPTHHRTILFANGGGGGGGASAECDSGRLQDHHPGTLRCADRPILW